MNYINFNHIKCCYSTGICERLTAGQGKLSAEGYWQFPCPRCLGNMLRALQVEGINQMSTTIKMVAICADGIEREFTPFTLEIDQVGHCDWLPSDPAERAAWDMMCRSPMAIDEKMAPGSVKIDGERIVGFRDSETNKFIPY
jgi:hypothetical protein